MGWRTAAKPIEILPQWMVWQPELPHQIDEVPQDRPVGTICGSGYRSAVSASLLLHHGHKQVVNVLGGMTAWQTAGLPTARE